MRLLVIAALSLFLSVSAGQKVVEDADDKTIVRVTVESCGG